MLRDIIKIDEEKCNGCGLCIPGCPEGALQIIDGKARLVSDMMCDGLGACIGQCPEGAIEIQRRDAEPYDEIKTISLIAQQGKNTVIAHIKHLKDHGELELLKQAVNWLKNNKHVMSFDLAEVRHEVHAYSPCSKTNEKDHGNKVNIRSIHGEGCPGSAVIGLRSTSSGNSKMKPETASHESQLRQWPVQLHLLDPAASYFEKANVLLAADCVAFTVADFHENYLKGKTLAIACPKLDTNQEVYLHKLISMINDSGKHPNCNGNAGALL